jgi:hypothetical protein
MKAATRRISALLKATSEIAADKMDEEAGIYSCLAQRRYSHHNNDAD